MAPGHVHRLAELEVEHRLRARCEDRIRNLKDTGVETAYGANWPKATVRLRQRVTKGPGSRAAGIAMAFKLIESAQGRWRAVNAPHLVPLVRAGATFSKGKLVERNVDTDLEKEAA